MNYDPYAGQAMASGMPSYYNPYQTYTDRGYASHVAQQAGQAGVPGRDAPAMAGAGRKVRMRAPTGHVREVDAQHVAHYQALGAVPIA